MSGLEETPVWEPEIYQWETDDPVEGGPAGIDNVPTRQLANRTSYLKQEVESTQAGQGAHAAAADPHPQYAPKLNPVLTAPAVAAAPAQDDNSLLLSPTAWVVTAIATAIANLVASSPATLDTLNELAASLGNDANFATTVMNALALKAPLVSPALTGSPTAPTPAKFDSSTKLATTEHMRLAGLFTSGRTTISATATLTAVQAVNNVVITGSGVALTLPLISSVPDGTIIPILSTNSGNSVARQGADVIYVNSANLTSLPLGNGDSLWVMSSGGAWHAFAGSVQLGYSNAFGSNLAMTGHGRVGKWIIQWGRVTVPAGANATFDATLSTAWGGFIAGVVTDVGAACVPYGIDGLSNTQVRIKGPYAMLQGDAASTTPVVRGSTSACYICVGIAP